MPVSRPLKKSPNRWQISAWVLGDERFQEHVQALLVEEFASLGRRSSAFRDQCGAPEPVTGLEMASFMVLPGVGVELARSEDAGRFGNTTLQAVLKKIQKYVGWEQGFAVVVAAWVTAPLAANALNVTPEAYVIQRRHPMGTGFVTSGLGLAGKMRNNIQQTALQEVRAPSGALLNEADTCAYQALMEGVRPEVERSPLWQQARQRELDAVLPAATPRPWKPRF